MYNELKKEFDISKKAFNFALKAVKAITNDNGYIEERGLMMACVGAALLDCKDNGMTKEEVKVYTITEEYKKYVYIMMDSFVKMYNLKLIKLSK